MIGDSFSFNISNRAANNFPAGAGQIVRSNLFLLGQIPFLAGQTSITFYLIFDNDRPLFAVLSSNKVPSLFKRVLVEHLDDPDNQEQR